MLLIGGAISVAVTGCGGGGSNHSTSAANAPARTGSTPAITLVEGTFPQSLDPGKDYSIEGAEVNWLVYTGLTTYAHAEGQRGAIVIPGLATGLPKISDGGRTYTVTLRTGLKYSNGQPVKASDFIRSVERAIHIPWSGAGAFITPIIVGGTAVLDRQGKDDLRDHGYTTFLNRIGLKASIELIADADCFTTIGTRRLHPQTGLANWTKDFPDPADFYLLLDGHAIQPTDNPNFGEIDDPRLDRTIARLQSFPASSFSASPASGQGTGARRAVRGWPGPR